MFTQLNGKIQSSRKQTRAAFKALGSIDDVKVQKDAEARKAAYSTGAKHVRRHCNTIIDAKETIIDLSAASVAQHFLFFASQKCVASSFLRAALKHVRMILRPLT